VHSVHRSRRFFVRHFADHREGGFRDKKTSQATPGGTELCLYFILHNFSFILAAQGPVVGFVDWLGFSCKNKIIMSK